MSPLSAIACENKIDKRLYFLVDLNCIIKARWDYEDSVKQALPYMCAVLGRLVRPLRDAAGVGSRGVDGKDRGAGG